MEEISEELVIRIAKEYGTLQKGLAKFRELKADKSGWCGLHYAADPFIAARDAYEFLSSPKVPSKIQAELKISELEEEVLEFGAVRVNFTS